jgi:glycosyltransferase involved in cell wall biosynthesis
MAARSTPRVLVVAYHFPPIGGAGVQRNAKFVRYLPELGYECVVVTGPGPSSYLWTPTDASLLEDVPPETEVHRVQGPEPPMSSGIRAAIERRLLIPGPVARWWHRGLVDLGTRVGADCDVIYGSLIPYTTGDAVAELAARLRKPWVVDLQDPWALDEMWLYPSGVHRRVDLTRMRRVLRHADAVVMNTPEAAERVQHAFPELRSRLVVSIPNGFDAADFSAPPPPPRSDGKFRIVHTGYLHTESGLRLRKIGWMRRVLGGRYAPVDMLTRSHFYLLQALRQAADDDPSVPAAVEVVLAGVVNQADRDVAAHSVVPIELPGYIDHVENVDLLRSADLLFLPMHDLPSGTRAGLVPGKTYEYLASRRPILAAVPEGDARELLLEAGNAFVCRPDDVDGMTQILLELIRRWRGGEGPAAPRDDVLARYERRELASSLAGVFDRLLGRPTTQTPSAKTASV